MAKTRSVGAKQPAKPNPASSRRSSNGNATRKRKAQDLSESQSDKDDESGGEEGSDFGDDEEPEDIDSDNLDDFSDSSSTKKRKKRKVNGKTPSPKKLKPSPTKPSRSPKKQSQEEGSDEFDEDHEVVGEIVQAPTTGLVPAGQISQNTLNFLSELKDPAKNDRTWFKLHEPVFRHAETEWKNFIEAFTDVMTKADPQVPHLPPKDVIYRIYRDVRFSNDKTPYKCNFSASFSRSGRKGIFAGYHVSLKPGDTIIAAGSWCPDKNELATLRHNIQRNPARLKNIIASKDFVKYFGEPKHHPKGERQNIFGREDALKVAPKGIDKNHPEIELLKQRSFVVSCRFLDSEVLEPNFKDRLGKVVEVVRPFVHCLNDMMTIREESEDEEED